MVSHLLRVRLLACGLALSISLTLLTHGAFAEAIQLRLQRTVLANSAPLKPGIQAIPCVADWNGDGLQDLLVGYRSADKIALYLNTGTLQQPVFTTFANLQAGGADIYQAGASCGAPAPWVCDYDRDGKRDLLVGNGTDGKIYLYRNTNTDAQPVLSAGVALNLGSATLSVISRATPYVCDYDADGLDDLLSGDGNGNVHFFKNTGTASAPRYTADVLVTAGGATLNFGARSAIRFCDWDGDGRKDLVGSGSDNAAWCKNISSNNTVVLNAPVRLRAPVGGTLPGLVNIDTSYRMRLEVVDWNHDDVLDLLIGDSTGVIYLYEGYHFVMRKTELQPGGAVRCSWESADNLKYNVLAGTDPANLSSVLHSNLPSAGDVTACTNQVTEPMQFFRVAIAP